MTVTLSETEYLFFSYHKGDDTSRGDEPFVGRVREQFVSHTKAKCAHRVFFWSEGRRDIPFPEKVGQALDDCSVFVLFIGETFGETQRREAHRALDRHVAVRLEKRQFGMLVVQLPNGNSLPDDLNKFRDFEWITCVKKDELEAREVAHEICRRLNRADEWTPDFGIPDGYPFPLEKRIIEAFVKGGGKLTGNKAAECCVTDWPLERRRGTEWENRVPVDKIGTLSAGDDRVIVDARASQFVRDQVGPVLTFAEARPRHRLRLPHPKRLHAKDEPGLNVGVVVSGGIAPGINSVISGIVDRHDLYSKFGQRSRSHQAVDDVGRHPQYPLFIHGFTNGFGALERGGQNAVRPLHTDEWRRQIKDEANSGGSLLGTARNDSLLAAADPPGRARAFDRMLSTLRSKNIDVLYIIGGDGSMRAAHALQVAADEDGYELTVVGIPKTMDNDILWVWQSFGFLSAVAKAKEFIVQLHTEATSNPRLCVIQLFGSDSGFVVSHAAVASGVVDLALIPEIPFSMSKVGEYIRERLLSRSRNGNAYGVIVMSETAIPTDVQSLIQEDEALPPGQRVLRLEQEEQEAIDHYLRKERRVFGQTPDALRTGGLKIVSRYLQNAISGEGDGWEGFRVFTNEPRHLLRSLEPSSADIIFGHRLGCLAVDNAMAGFTDFMISQWLTEFVLVPLPLVVLGRKRVPPEGIFWRSVVDSTGQPAKLV